MNTFKNPNIHLFKYCPQCGREQLIVSSEKSFACKTCHFKFYLNTAAAGIALIFDNKKLIVTKRKHDPEKGMLDLPGGFADPGESIEGCLIREIKEELNLDIIELNYFCSVPNTYIYNEVTYTITDFAFICKVKSFESIIACDDISDFYFFHLSDIDRKSFGLDSPKIVIDKLLKKNPFT